VRAVWYDQQGPAADVLQIGDLPDPQPGPGEVRVRLRYSGINPGDTKKRRGWLGSTMPYPRVIPHSDGSGVIDQIGPGVDTARVGQRVWVYGAQSYRAFGTAAHYAVVPDKLAVDLPDEVDDRIGACLGIPGITAHRAVFADGPSTAPPCSSTALGAVGSLAAQLAHWAGAAVITTVRRNHLPKLQTPPWPRLSLSTWPIQPTPSGHMPPTAVTCPAYRGTPTAQMILSRGAQHHDHLPRCPATSWHCG
jgi:NADPH:quinone reductase